MGGATLHRALAAKFDSKSAARGTPAYHPLVCHMADVAAVALAMWDLVLPPSSRSILASGLGLSEEEAREWVAYVAGCHDLGKATRQFQAKDPNHAAWLNAPGFTASDPQKDPGHGLRTAGFFCEHAMGLGMERLVASQLGIITGGHHGRFLVADPQSLNPEALDETRQPAWSQARASLTADFHALFDLPSRPSQELPPKAAMLLAGLISVADWIGSIEERFVWDPGGADDLHAYFGRVRRIARDVVREDRWVPEPVRQAAAFRELFPFRPRRLQSIVEALMPTVSAGGLVIIEAPMGEGKTEAALYAAHQWESHGARGSYIALPTQATANQMYGRVRQHLARRDPTHPANLVLAHGGAWEQPRYTPSAIHGEEAAASGDAAATEWFLPKKRALLAPYGVGTVDQALMAVLQVRHVFVRLFGLAGKPVVIDEVHAYDTYMTGLLERLLEWLGALGSPVVLLSATLPSGRRERLVAAYSRGMDSTAEPPPPPPYPRVTWVGASASGAAHAEPSERSVRSLALERVADSTEALSSALSHALGDGGCAAVICNTVARAQEVYRQLSATFNPGTELGLFHARFLEKDRRRIEEECLRQFGPPDANPERPPRFVLVATQVIEQSLDVDFDVMFTEFAPVDLLLQRSGRLQRHDRGPRTPVLRILWPGTGDDGLPRFGDATSVVYDEHILLRTWHALRERPAIAIPGDVQELVDLVYCDDEASPAGADAALAAKWHNTWKELVAKREKEGAIARQPLIPSPDFIPEEFLHSLTGPVLLEGDPTATAARRARTRYEERPSLEIIWIQPGEVTATIDSVDDDANVRWLHDRGVTVTGFWTIQAANQLPQPEPWSKHPRLRFARAVVAPDGPVRIAGGPSLQLDAELGVLIAFERSGDGYDSD